ncbi:hypothetical protein F4694_005495 [Bacillus niacini]|uniref:Uncharacterized protein n=1 Tax=Neobacillus niacini TaxID=86668 RepID=A0A852TLR9_9BACI|nr:hypothetical protein [Neobacillus niacini]
MTIFQVLYVFGLHETFMVTTFRFLYDYWAS